VADDCWGGIGCFFLQIQRAEKTVQLEYGCMIRPATIEFLSAATYFQAFGGDIKEKSTFDILRGVYGAL